MADMAAIIMPPQVSSHSIPHRNPNLQNNVVIRIGGLVIIPYSGSSNNTAVIPKGVSLLKAIHVHASEKAGREYISIPPSVLVENFFMDSRHDCHFLLSESGQQAIVNLHVDGIIRYLSSVTSYNS